MIKEKYLYGLHKDLTDTNWPKEIVAITQIPNRVYRYISTYEDGKNFKQQIFSQLKTYGQDEVIKSWEFHHIVEWNHYKEIARSWHIKDYDDLLPCVLMSKEEHQKIYNSLFRIKETKLLWHKKREQPASGYSRRLSVVSPDPFFGMKRQPQNVDNFREKIDKISRYKQMYLHMYHSEPILKQIAINVFSDVLHSYKVHS